uniref:Uncharacterized protein n=1 Tax=Cacopsylla melanoneura TaxID=428564 RepID=A0A8D8U6Q2_9HEMI
MLTSERTCTPTLSCLVVPPCTLVLLTVCRRKSLPWLPLPLRSRSLLPPRESTPSGLEDLSWLPCLPSNRCGSPSRNTTSPALESFTANVSKQLLLLCFSYALVLSKLHCISSFNVLYIAINSAWFII